MTGTVSVTRDQTVIVARYTGAMTTELVEDAQQQIRALLQGATDRRILYDTVEMEKPPMHLAMSMRRFDAEIRDRVAKSATIVSNAAIAFLAKVAFAASRNHTVFYGDTEEALAWVRS